jgi:hypothetical protein
METPPALPQEIWERTPPEVQAYIRALEARVETLTSMVHVLQEQVGTLQEQLHQTSRNSSRPHRAIRPSLNVHIACGVNAGVAVNPAILAIPGPCSQSLQSMRWW